MTIETPNADTANSNNTSHETNNQTSPPWFIDEGVPGVGNRPDWLGDKFKTVADMAKSYRELEKNLGQAPEKYDFSKSKYLDPDYAPFQELQEFAKSKRVPQEVFDKMLESVDKYMGEFSIDETEELKSFGDMDKLKTLKNWAHANLSKEAFDALNTNLKTADGLKALDEIRSKMMSNSTQIPNGNDSISNGSTMDEVQAELQNNLDKYKTDPKYQKEIQAKFAAIAAQSSFSDKTW